MSFTGMLMKTASKYVGSPSSIANQDKTLRRLLTVAADTRFGFAYEFDDILRSKHVGEAFANSIPIYTYDKLFQYWWHRTMANEPDVCWPGKVKYFALSSGTSNDTSKRIPVTPAMLHAMRRVSLWQFGALSKMSLPSKFYSTNHLMLGGSADLNQVNGHFEGDLSGILANNLPFWFQPSYKPGLKIAREKVWSSKIDQITREAPQWNIGSIVGVPSWFQLLLENIVHHYKVDHIHEIWPNLSVFCHGGVSLAPYRSAFNRYFGKPMHYLETYLASEGFVGWQDDPEKTGMKLTLNNGIYYEFLPFNEDNFTENGVPKSNAKAIQLRDVEEGESYAIVISTCAGAWRYLLGDTIKFTSKKDHEIVITGRVSQSLNLCGEHISVDNLSQAVAIACSQLNISIKEFTVAGVAHHDYFAHKWYVALDEEIDPLLVKLCLDEALKKLNDDYRTEREYALKDLLVEVLPSEVFYDWMRARGKMGGQNKFPRVLTGDRLKDWDTFKDQAAASI